MRRDAKGLNDAASPTGEGSAVRVAAEDDLSGGGNSKDD